MFSGSIVALITPFCNDQVDVEALKKLVLWHLQEGTDGIVVCGSTGEASLLTLSERRLAIETVIAQVQGRIPVIVGCGTPSTQETLQLVTEAQSMGADAALVVTPYYVRPTEEGLYQHFKVLSGVGLPIILYNNPGRAGATMSVDAVVRLSDLPNVVGIKDSCDDLTRVIKMRSRIQKPFVYLSGDDPLTTAYLAQGGDGFISITANVVPHLCSQLMKAWKAEDRETFNSLRDALLPLHEVLLVETNPTPVKYAVSTLGYCLEEVRLPLVGLRDEFKEKVKKSLLALDEQKAA
jgi:4-hydroxy-tetrahydrodipicolinate synthase